MRVIAILAAYNEERFIAGCLEHFFGHGVEVYIIDNCSTDRTAEIARSYVGRGLAGIESFPSPAGKHDWHGLLQRKEELAATLEADWFMHADPDEIRLPPRAGQTLTGALADAEAQGYNAVNFQEFTFIPTLEEPDHDHADFGRTMLWYYPFLPSFPHRLNAWQRQPARVELAWSGGHVVRFPGLRMSPVSFPLRHYPFLSVEHLLAKYRRWTYARAALKRGWHGWRASLKPNLVKLPSQAELRLYTSDEELDPRNPRAQHFAEEWAAKQRRWRRWL